MRGISSSGYPARNCYAIADVNLEAAHQAASELEVSDATGDYRQLLKDEGIQAVVICSSTDTHAGIMVEAALAGKHVFCEKPIALEYGQNRSGSGRRG